jgi:hypothetical protein
MRSSNIDSTGFTVLEMLLLILTLAIISVAGYFVSNHINQKTVVTAKSTSASPSSRNTKYVGLTNFTGIYGVASTSMCPHEQLGHPCPMTPISNVIISVNAVNSNTVVTTTTDSTGSYHLEIVAGSYIVNASAGHEGRLSCFANTIPVVQGRATRSDISCDSGIR